MNRVNFPESTLQSIIVRAQRPSAIQALCHFDGDITDFFRRVFDELDAF
jgi:hypothetical protein